MSLELNNSLSYFIELKLDAKKLLLIMMKFIIKRRFSMNAFYEIFRAQFNSFGNFLN